MSGYHITRNYLVHFTSIIKGETNISFISAEKVALIIKSNERAEAEFVPSSSLVEVEVGVKVEVCVEVEVGVILLFRVGGWSGLEWLEKS